MLKGWTNRFLLLFLLWKTFFLLGRAAAGGVDGDAVVVNDNKATPCPGKNCDVVGSLDSAAAPPNNNNNNNNNTSKQGNHIRLPPIGKRQPPKGGVQNKRQRDLLPDPFWEPPDFDTDEEEEEYYGPLDRFWRHSAIYKTLRLGDVDYYPVMEQCLNERLTPKDWMEIRRPQDLDRKVGTRFMDEEGYGPVFLIEIRNAMSPIHAKAVRALNMCVRTHISQLYEKRPMYQVYKVDESADESLKDEMGGNNPTHLNSIIGIFLPDVVREQYETLRMAYHYAGWQAMVVRDDIMGKYRAHAFGLENAMTEVSGAGMRACEYLNYEGFSRLMEHQDGYATSVVLNVMLSDANDYEGGEFYIQDKVEGEYHVVRPDQYSALAFLGGTFEHGVDPIKSGTREALSTEFWYYPDLPFGVNLCAAEFQNVEEYIRQCNEVQWNEELEEFDYEIPCDLEFPSSSIYGVCHSTKGTIKEKNVYEEEEEEEKQQKPPTSKMKATRDPRNQDEL